MTLKSGRSNCTSAPICGTPAESRTRPDTDADAAPQTGRGAKDDQHGETGEMGLRFITDLTIPPRPWQFSLNDNPRTLPNSRCPAGVCAGLTTYSTTKGADCAISCFEIASFIFTVTLYLPGSRPAIGRVFSTVNWSLCAPKSFESSCFCRITVPVAAVRDLVGHRG